LYCRRRPALRFPERGGGQGHGGPVAGRRRTYQKEGKGKRGSSPSLSGGRYREVHAVLVVLEEKKEEKRGKGPADLELFYSQSGKGRGLVSRCLQGEKEEKKKKQKE